MCIFLKFLKINDENNLFFIQLGSITFNVGLLICGSSATAVRLVRLNLLFICLEPFCFKGKLSMMLRGLLFCVSFPHVKNDL